MAQEFTINSNAIESKINQLLPSQGGFGAGVDFSASTMVIPIVDLTETAEGSNVREDLQTSLSHNNTTFTQFFNTTSNLVATTGYYSVLSNVFCDTTAGSAYFDITDSISAKKVYQVSLKPAGVFSVPRFIVKLEAGDTLRGVSTNTSMVVNVTTRQIADINGNLTAS